MRFRTRTAPPLTSYGFHPPYEAVVTGWRCPSAGCGAAADGELRHQPAGCPRCGAPVDPCFAEPWATQARGPWRRFELERAHPADRVFWTAELLAWRYGEALRANDGAAAEAVRAEGHRLVEAHVNDPGFARGRVHGPVVRAALTADLLDPAVDELLRWFRGVDPNRVARDGVARTDCWMLLDGALDLLERPDTSGRPAVAAVRRSAAALRDDVRSLLPAGLARRSTHLRSVRVPAQGRHPVVPQPRPPAQRGPR